MTFGKIYFQCLEASNILAKEGTKVEIIDLRSIQPWDRQTIVTSLEKTGRLVIVQEDGRSCSVGQMVISEIMSNADSFNLFVAPPQLVSKPDIHIGYNPIYEYAALPDTDQVIKAIRNTMED